ncbi:uncharacterized protein LOC132180018 isoform X2 [Corylus avellana]|uniref:uncharacterized protein LOC132180018 isoform X2 n=1 Tax=Corylus avellana TaxID=13451 RepID=UPI00286B6EDF|nr:uncharacterized protein LOC132180018 isoform X2 [Corylus avellana]
MQSDIYDLFGAAHTRWLKPAEVLFILQNHEKYKITEEPPRQPASGSLFLFNKRVLRFFRRDGHNWRKKKDGKTVVEARERLKVRNVEALNCYYAHGEQNPGFQRRSYWMLDPAYEHIVLVHYRELSEDIFDPCHLFRGEQFDDNKDDKIHTSISSSVITTNSSYADNLDPLDLHADPPDLAEEALSQCDEEGIEKQITSESQGMVFDVETVEMKSSGEKIGVEFEASGQDKKFEIEDIGIERPETSDIDRNTFSIIQGEAHQLCRMWGGLGLTETPKEEDWKNVKEIYLMHNELSSLPENPRCSMLLALFLHGNHKLRTIPPSFFDNMPALQILNLSRTGIRSLPESIVRLVNLKRLSLSYCHCFMRLSPKVGELKQLEVLDLEGTDIMDLPKEIKELTNLTCLKVSLYSCMSNGRRAMQSDVVVPCGIISALSHLEELNMSVNPDDKRWNACVEAIVTEVCTLQSLNTLKFYFPRVELVRHFLLNSPMWVHPSLSNFRFTVGHHVKRTMSRLPSDVEFELERWERCLKYINGVAVPREIKKVLQYSTAFFLERHATVKKLSDFGIETMKQLKYCVVGECNEVEVIIDATDAHEEASEADAHEADDEANAHEEDCKADAHEGDSESDTQEEDSEADAHEEDNEADTHEEDDEVEACREDGSSGIVSKTSGAKTIVLGSLEYLYIYYMKNLRRIWEGPVQPKCLSLLKSLTLRTCPQLTTIFTTCLLDNLCNLEELTVEDCPSIKTLVSCKISAEPKTSDFLPNLKRISLHYMPGLVSISSGLHIAPRLECLSFYNCPNLKHLLIEEVSSKDLKKIKGEWNWWVALKWRCGRPSYLDDIFVPINI